MLLFAHVGITLGAATAISGLVKLKRGAFPGEKTAGNSQPGAESVSQPALKKPAFSAWFEALGKCVDIRFLIIGSLLPDIIDKPLALFPIGPGRGYAHTLAFALLVFFIGLYFYFKQKKTLALGLSFGVFSHLILDSMWSNVHVLLWPFYQWTFPPGSPSQWLPLWLSELPVSPRIDTFEGIGLLICLLFAWTVFRNKKVKAFLKRGKFWNP
jgi:inner membrane protein